MRNLVMVWCACALIAGARASCYGCIEGQCYSMNSLVDAEGDGLAVHRNTNTLYVVNAFKSIINVCNLHTKTCDNHYDGYNIEHIAVDQATGAVYGCDGRHRVIYIFDHQIRRWSPFGDAVGIVRDVQFKEHLYYATNVGIYMFIDGESRIVAGTSQFSIQEFVIDKNNDIYFFKTDIISTPQILRVSKGEVYSEDWCYNFRACEMNVDRDGNFVLFDRGSQTVAKYIGGHLREVGAIEESLYFSPVFDKDNNILIIDIFTHRVFQLKQENAHCMVVNKTQDVRVILEAVSSVRTEDSGKIVLPEVSYFNSSSRSSDNSTVPGPLYWLYNTSSSEINSNTSQTDNRTTAEGSIYWPDYKNTASGTTYKPYYRTTEKATTYRSNYGTNESEPASRSYYGTNETRTNYRTNETGTIYRPYHRTNETGTTFRSHYRTNETGAIHRLYYGTNETNTIYRPYYGTNETGTTYRLYHRTNETGKTSRSHYRTNETGGTHRLYHGTNETSTIYRPYYGTNETGTTYRPYHRTNETGKTYRSHYRTNETGGTHRLYHGTNETSTIYRPYYGTNETGTTYRPYHRTNETGKTSRSHYRTNETGGTHRLYHSTNETSTIYRPYYGTNETGATFRPYDRANQNRKTHMPYKDTSIYKSDYWTKNTTVDEIRNMTDPTSIASKSPSQPGNMTNKEGKSDDVSGINIDSNNTGSVMSSSNQALDVTGGLNISNKATDTLGSESKCGVSKLLNIIIKLNVSTT